MCRSRDSSCVATVKKYFSYLMGFVGKNAKFNVLNKMGLCIVFVENTPRKNVNQQRSLPDLEKHKHLNFLYW